MKTSQFNTFFTYKSNIIGYNSFSNDFVILEPELYELYNAAKNEGIVGLSEIHPEFYNVLIDKGFIVNTEINEVDKVKELVEKIDQDNSFYQLVINPTMNCNFKCWYCYETHIKDSKMTSIEISKVIKHVEYIINSQPLKEFHISWFGGEPLLYFNQTVLPILKESNKLCNEKKIKFSSGFTTNGFLINENILEECNNYGVDAMQITLDGHRKRHNEVRFVNNERGSYDEIIVNIKKCLSSKIKIICRLNISKETLSDNLQNIITDFSNITSDQKEFLTFSFNKVWQEGIDLDDEILSLIDYFKSFGYKTQFDKYLNMVEDSCYADKRNHATINYNGEVFKCTARDFTSDNREGVLREDGKIEWSEKFEMRMNAKFKNPPCLECRILPICNGGCSQNALENIDNEYCVQNFDEEKKTNIIRDKFLSIIT